VPTWAQANAGEYRGARVDTGERERGIAAPTWAQANRVDPPKRERLHQLDVCWNVSLFGIRQTTSKRQRVRSL